MYCLIHRLLGFVLVACLVVLPMRAQTPTSPPILAGITGGGTVELGQRATLSVAFGGSTAPAVLTYQWRKNSADIAGATSSSYVIAAAAAADAGTYAVTVTNSVGSSVATTTLTVNPAAAPVISSQPRAVVVQVGQSATFTVTATGSFPITYRWRKDGTDITGAISPFLVISAVVSADAGAYTVVVTNDFGSATSLAAALTVNAATPTIISSATPADVTALQGTSAALSVSVNVGSLPRTYQWLKNGVPVTGTGATTGTLSFAAVTLGDAGKYSVSITNPAGTVTSREATLTVTPATPITIAIQPSPRAVFQGQAASFSVSPGAGSQPITYQWLKNGVPIAGATNIGFSFTAVALTDEGSYSVVLTNAAGSVTSSAAALTVAPAVLPAFTRQPVGLTVPYFGSFNLSATVTGTSPLTYQWKKDGVALYTNGPDISFSSVTAADTGVYTLVVTNAAGSVTTNPVTVTVAAPVLPVIVTQPVALQVATGQSATFFVGYTSVGSGEVSVQWYKNGVAIPGANSASLFAAQNYGIGFVQESDAADYTVVLTSRAGSVTSAAARLTVLAPTPPKIGSWPSDQTTGIGQSMQMSAYGATGSPPLLTQWFKDGVAIPGATTSPFYVNRMAESDFGVYTVTISNAGGIISSPPINVRQYGDTSPPWLAAERFGTIVYFLAKSPNRIERYDLAAERWLTTTTLTDSRVPAVLLPTAEGVYLAYERSLVRRSLDLATETPVINAASDITSLFVVDQFLYYTAYVNRAVLGTVYATASFRRTTTEAGPTLSTAVHSAVLAPTRRLVFGVYDGGSSQRVFACDAEGRIGAANVTSFADKFPLASRAFLFPGEEFVANGAGTIYRLTDLSYVGSLGVSPNDLVFLGDGTPVVLRGRTVQSIQATTFLETGTAGLPFYGWREFVSGGNVFVFGLPATTGAAFQVAKVAGTALVKAVTPTATVAAGERYSIDDAFLGDDGVVAIFSRSKRALLRWSAPTRSFLAPVLLRDAPLTASQTLGSKRALFGYLDGQMTEIPLSASDSAERQLGALGNRISALTDLGSQVMANVAGGGYYTPDLRMTIDAQGHPAFVSPAAADLYTPWPRGLGWDAGRRRLYSVNYNGFNAGKFQYDAVPASGVLPSAPAASIAVATGVFGFQPDGGLVVTGEGRVLNADLAPVGTLANDILDGAWLPSDLYTLRNVNGETQVQRWSRTNYLQTGLLTLRGVPVRIFRLSDTQLVVVTNTLGFATLSIVNADLSIASTSASPVVPTDFSGVYFAKAGAAGNLALYVRADRTGMLIAHFSDVPSELVALNVALKADGSFVVTVADLLSPGATRSVTGAIGVGGSISGTIGSLVFTGSKSVGSTSGAGFYQAAAINGASGSAYAIIGADGQALVVARNAAADGGGMGTLDLTGRLAVTTATGAKLSGTINSVTGSLSAAADKDALSGSVFAGLRDDVTRTDRLANIATRGRAGAGDEVMIAGFVITGSATRTILVRAIGPALTSFGVGGVLADPRLALYRGNNKIAESDNWGAESASSDIAAAATRVGAFPLSATGADAALLATLDPGSYSAQVSGPNGAGGVALVEVYDASQGANTAASSRLVNIATRGRAGSGDDTLIAGIVVTGNAPKRMLVRAIGPTLASFGVAGTLADPVLTILSGSTALSTNDDWGSVANSAPSATEITAATASVGAFALPNGSKDSCVLITLQPGSYTAQVSGKAGATGVALVEVYEVSN